MFTKQVSGPLDSLDSPSSPPRPNKFGRTRRKDLVTGLIRVLVPYNHIESVLKRGTFGRNVLLVGLTLVLTYRER
jgi:hypothetical protein